MTFLVCAVNALYSSGEAVIIIVIDRLLSELGEVFGDFNDLVGMGEVFFQVGVFSIGAHVMERCNGHIALVARCVFQHLLHIRRENRIGIDDFFLIAAIGTIKGQVGVEVYLLKRGSSRSGLPVAIHRRIPFSFSRISVSSIRAVICFLPISMRLPSISKKIILIMEMLLVFKCDLRANGEVNMG